jgi:hypothetical protein
LPWPEHTPTIRLIAAKEAPLGEFLLGFIQSRKENVERLLI